MKILCKNKHWEINKEYNLDKILYLLIDRPDYIHYWNDFYRENKKGVRHSKYDLPAIMYRSGNLEWYKNGKYHREINKPARLFYNNEKQYWLNNVFIK